MIKPTPQYKQYIISLGLYKNKDSLDEQCIHQGNIIYRKRALEVKSKSQLNSKT